MKKTVFLRVLFGLAAAALLVLALSAASFAASGESDPVDSFMSHILWPIIGVLGALLMIPFFALCAGAGRDGIDEVEARREERIRRKKERALRRARRAQKLRARKSKKSRRFHKRRRG